MARKTKRKKKDTAGMVNMDATMKKLQTQLTDPNLNMWTFTGAKGVRERMLKVNYDTLRNLVDRLPIVNVIINTRADQLQPYTKFSTDPREPGFTIIPKNPEKAKKQRIEREADDKVKALGDFFEQTGFLYDPDREDDFSDYVQQFVRDTLSIDQIATEIQPNRVGEAAAFWSLDGATIKRVNEESEFAKGIRFVQEIEDKIYNTYTNDQIVFDYKYKRSDVRFRGYGYSPLEQSIDLITTLLFGYNYIRDQLVRDRMPKGFISVMGDVSKPQLDSIRSYWYAAMSGAGGQWNIPILPSGKDGIGIDFKTLNQSNKDMEYHKLMQFVSSTVSAVFGFDLTEAGINSEESKPLVGNNGEAPQIQNSKERGKESMLAFLEQHMNKILRKVTTDYRFEFTGLNVEDESRREEVRTKRLKTTETINSLRHEDGKDPIEEDYADVVLNEQAVQIYMSSKQQEQQEKMMQQQQGGMGGMPGAAPEGEGQAQEEDSEGQSEDQSQSIFKSADMSKSLQDFKRVTRDRERVIRHVFE